VGKASPAIAAFVSGEWSPQMEGRVDTERYPNAAHIASNFVILKQGPAVFRPGTAYVQQVKSPSRAWLKRFEFSQTSGNSFVIEFGGGYCRFYTDHGPLLSTGNPAYNGGTAYVIGNQVVSGGITYYCIAATTGNAPPNATYWYPMGPYNGSATTAIYEIPNPYAAADLTDSFGEFTLQIEQQGDVLYIAGGAAGSGYPPYTLTRYANAPPNWVFAQYSPTDGPFADPIPLVPNQNIALTVTSTQGPTTTIQSWGGNAFAPTDVGRLVRIQSGYYNVTPWAFQVTIAAGAIVVNNGNNYIALNSGTTGSSPPVHTSGAVLDGTGGVLWLYSDSGYGVAQITAYTSGSQVTAKVLSRFPANVSFFGSGATITGITNALPAVVSATNTFANNDAVFIVGVQGMTQVNQTLYTGSPATGSAVTLAGVDSTGFGTYTSGGVIIANASLEWQLGAWSNTTEWPRALAFYKDRLFWAGKLHVWGSVPGAYSSHAPDQFGQQTTDSAMNEIVSGQDASNICWLSSAIILLIGTEGGEYGLDAANYSTSPLGPANVEILRQSSWRCRPIRPELIGTSVLYVQRAGRKVFAMDYNFYLNRYDSSDQSKFSYHISIGGITAVAYMQEPWSVVWATRDDGTLLSYTFNREDQVTAWARHNIGGNGIVESIAVIPAPDGLRDELWMIVNRTVNGQVVRTVEYMSKVYEGAQAGYAGDAQSSCWYVDCGVQYIAPPPVTVTGVAAFTLGPGDYQVTFSAANSFTAGQSVLVSGVQYTGTFNPNGVFVIGRATAVGFSASLASPPGSFAYVGGGTVSANAPGEGATIIAGIPSVLWGQTVSILADGGVQPQGQVSNAGILTVPGTWNVVTFGFPYQGNLVPMRPEGGADAGTAQGKLKQGATLVLRLVDSASGLVGQLTNTPAGTYVDPLGLTSIMANNQPAGSAPNGPTLDYIRYNDTTTELDSPPPIMSGDFPVSFPHAPVSDQDARDFYILVQQNDPLPMTVVGLFPSYKVEDPQ
jgi:hypothetical protein